MQTTVNPYMIPGLSNSIGKSYKPPIENIHQLVCDHFKIEPQESLHTQKIRCVEARTWTMLLSVCCGHSHVDAGKYFDMGHSNCSILTLRLSSSILIYKHSKECFIYFFHLLDLKSRIPGLRNMHIKSWLYRFPGNLN